MTDPIVAFELLMDAIARGVEDGIRLWAMTVTAAIAVVILCAWLYERHVRKSGK
jgi:hypothetical protein